MVLCAAIYMIIFLLHTLLALEDYWEFIDLTIIGGSKNGTTAVLDYGLSLVLPILWVGLGWWCITRNVYVIWYMEKLGGHLNVWSVSWQWGAPGEGGG